MKLTLIICGVAMLVGFIVVWLTRQWLDIVAGPFEDEE